MSVKSSIKKALRPIARPIISKMGIYDLKEQVQNLSASNELLRVVLKDAYDNEASRLKNILYYHGGSGNHGCEAIIRTICNIGEFQKEETGVYSFRPEEDKKFGIHNIISYIKRSNLDAEELPDYSYNNGTIALSIGGDNYCSYGWATNRLRVYNTKLNGLNAVTALVGCSVEPQVLEHQEVQDDLNQFSLITARESISYEALKKKGITRNTHLIPDSAFTLLAKELPLPEGFIQGKMIGFNVSSIAELYDSNDNIGYKNYVNLINYIIKNTDYSIALFPHVIQDFNTDVNILAKLYDEFSDTSRVILIEEEGCSELKGYIARCEMYIGARTHSTIAAYSSFVPTLVLGYSVKSRGIAKDIFGTYENYVKSIKDFENENDLIDCFLWLNKNKNDIKSHLEKFMPDYIKKCYSLKDELDKIRYSNPKKRLPNDDFCTGCGVCKSVCPASCIQMEYNKEGFRVPVTDYVKCNNCDMCRDACPLSSKRNISKVEKCYAVQNKDDNVLNNSSSGGVFKLLAENILKKNGIVYGAGFLHNVLKHLRISSLEDLEILQKSKYVESDLGDIFTSVKEDLEKNTLVLFSGTPCQVLGLSKFLNKTYDNLILVDLICHGVPSAKVFKKYLEFCENSVEAKIKEVNFRYKKYGWAPLNFRVTFENDDEIVEEASENIFMKGFLKNLTLRKSCYNCPANNFRSKSDITLGDYWTVKYIHEEFSDNKGTSAVILKTEKALNLFAEIKDFVKYVESDLEYLSNVNTCLVKSVAMPENRESFFKDIDNEDIIKLLERNL